MGDGQLSMSTADGLAVRGLEPGFMASKGELPGLLKTSDSLGVLARSGFSADQQALTI